MPFKATWWNKRPIGMYLGHIPHFTLMLCKGIWNVCLFKILAILYLLQRVRVPQNEYILHFSAPLTTTVVQAPNELTLLLLHLCMIKEQAQGLISSGRRERDEELQPHRHSLTLGITTLGFCGHHTACPASLRRRLRLTICHDSNHGVQAVTLPDAAALAHGPSGPCAGASTQPPLRSLSSQCMC